MGGLLCKPDSVCPVSWGSISERIAILVQEIIKETH